MRNKHACVHLLLFVLLHFLTPTPSVPSVSAHPCSPPESRSCLRRSGARPRPRSDRSRSASASGRREKRCVRVQDDAGVAPLMRLWCLDVLSSYKDGRLKCKCLFFTHQLACRHAAPPLCVRLPVSLPPCLCACRRGENMRRSSGKSSERKSDARPLKRSSAPAKFGQ